MPSRAAALPACRRAHHGHSLAARDGGGGVEPGPREFRDVVSWHEAGQPSVASGQQVPGGEFSDAIARDDEGGGARLGLRAAGEDGVDASLAEQFGRLRRTPVRLGEDGGGPQLRPGTGAFGSAGHAVAVDERRRPWCASSPLSSSRKR